MTLCVVLYFGINTLSILPFHKISLLICFGVYLRWYGRSGSDGTLNDNACRVVFVHVYISASLHLCWHEYFGLSCLWMSSIDVKLLNICYSGLKRMGIFSTTLVVPISNDGSDNISERVINVFF